MKNSDEKRMQLYLKMKKETEGEKIHDHKPVFEKPLDSKPDVVDKAAIEFNNDRVLDLHLSVLRNREDPHKHINSDKKNARKRRMVITMAFGVCSLILLGWATVNRGSYSFLK